MDRSRRKLKLTPGVADVNIYGGQMPTYEARVSADALRRYGVTLAQVYTALADNNAARGGAYIEHNDQQEVIRGLGLAKGPEDIANIVVATGPGRRAGDARDARRGAWRRPRSGSAPSRTTRPARPSWASR